MLGRRASEQNLFIGSGIDNWSSEVLARNYMHSQFLFLLYSGGLISVALYGWLMAAAARVALGMRSPVAMIYVALVMSTGILEVMVNPTALDGTSIAVLGVLVMTISQGRIQQKDLEKKNARTSLVAAKASTADRPQLHEKLGTSRA